MIYTHVVNRGWKGHTVPSISASEPGGYLSPPLSDPE